MSRGRTKTDDERGEKLGVLVDCVVENAVHNIRQVMTRYYYFNFENFMKKGSAIDRLFRVMRARHVGPECRFRAACLILMACKRQGFKYQHEVLFDLLQECPPQLQRSAAALLMERIENDVHEEEYLNLMYFRMCWLGAIPRLVVLRRLFSLGITVRVSDADRKYLTPQEQLSLVSASPN